MEAEMPQASGSFHFSLSARGEGSELGRKIAMRKF
jgi:hypothetical protein